METRERQWEILSCLLEEKEAKQGPDGGHHLDQKKIVVNMSKRSLSSSEESIIALGSNLAPAPTSISKKTIIAETEAVADEDAAKLITAVQSCLTNPKLPKSNITKGQMRVPEKLGEDKGVAILSADKGNATVVLNKDGYNQNMKDLLKDVSYK